MQLIKIHPEKIIQKTSTIDNQHLKILMECNDKLDKEFTKLINNYNIHNITIDEFEQIQRIKETQSIFNERINYLKNILNLNDSNIKYTTKLTDFTYTNPSKLIINNREFEVSKWSDIIVEISKYGKLKNEEKFTEIKNKIKGHKRQYFSSNRNDLTRGKKIDNNTYIETNFSANEIVKISKKILSELNINDDVVISVNKK